MAIAGLIPDAPSIRSKLFVVLDPKPRARAPVVAIWFHQPRALVAELARSLLASAASRVESACRLFGWSSPRKRLRPGRTTGSLTTAFVVELPPGTLSDVEVESCTRSVDAATR